MRGLSRLTVVLSCIALTATLTACGLIGGSKEPDTILGRYDAVAVGSESMMLPASETFEKESYIEIKEKGKAVFAINGDAQNLKWEADDEDITFSDAVESLDGTIEDDIIKLDFAGSIIYFAKGWADTSALGVKTTDDTINDMLKEYGVDPDSVAGLFDEETDTDNNDETAPEEETAVDGYAEDGHKLSATEPSGASGEYLSEEDLYRLTNWLHNVDWKTVDYDTIVGAFGQPTLDDGNKGPNSLTEYGTHCFTWKATDTVFLYVGFMSKDGETWPINNMNTCGYTYEDCEGADISGLPGM